MNKKEQENWFDNFVKAIADQSTDGPKIVQSELDEFLSMVKLI